MLAHIHLPAKSYQEPTSQARWHATGPWTQVMGQEDSSGWLWGGARLDPLQMSSEAFRSSVFPFSFVSRHPQAGSDCNCHPFLSLE